MAYGHRGYRHDRREAHADEQRGHYGDGDAKPGYALQKGAERPGKEQQLHRRLASQPGDALTDDGDGTGFVHDAVEHQRHPDDVQDV